MNEAAFEAVMNALTPVAEELNLRPDKLGDDAVLRNDETAVQVVYSEEDKLFRLYRFDWKDGEAGEKRELAAWLFDDAHNLRDAKAVGADFADVLRESFGIKQKPEKRKIALPEKSSGESADPAALAQRFLALFPVYKEKYKEHVEEHGDFLYEQFFAEYAAPKLRELLKENAKKQLEKFVSMLDELYVIGNLEVTGLITLTIVAGAVGYDDGLWATLSEYMSQADYLRPAANAMIRYARSKKLVS